MAPPDNDRGRPTSNRDALTSLATAKQLDAPEGTAPPPTVDASAVLVLEAELAQVLAEPPEVTR